MPFLAKIFNLSLASFTFPALWKRALVLALNKVSSPSGPADLRPIALLCFLSKMLKRLVYMEITEFTNVHNLIDEFQSGYKTGHSTQTSLLRLNEDVRKAIDYRLVTILVLFDFSKAFDTVCHVTLLRKLRTLGFSIKATKWVALYLVVRQQAVSTRAVESPPAGYPLI